MRRTLLALLLLLFPAVAWPATTRVVVGDLVLEAPTGLEAELGSLADDASRIVPELERDLGVRARGPYRIVLLPASRSLDPELAQIDELAPRWASGFLVGPLRLGAVRLGQVRRYPYDGAEEVLAHEIAHMLLYDAARDPLPAWLSEGIATYEGRRRGMRDFVVAARAVLLREPPTLAQLDSDFAAGPGRVERAYAAALDFVAQSVRRHGADFVPRLVDELERRTLEDAWRVAADEPLEVSERKWRRSSVWLHRWLPLLASTSTGWLGITLLAVLAGVVRRRRDRAIRERWEAEEALAERRRDAADDERPN